MIPKFVKGIGGKLLPMGKDVLIESVDFVPGAGIAKKVVKTAQKVNDIRQEVKMSIPETASPIIRVRRFLELPESTIGLMEIITPEGQGNEYCFTMEDQFQEQKVAGETRIPAGTYSLELRTEGGFHQRYSEKYEGMHQGMVHIQDVPGFEYILIHTGNRSTETEGCLLVGNQFSFSDPDFIGASGDAYMRVYPAIAYGISAVPPGNALIEIVNGFVDLNAPPQEQIAQPDPQVEPQGTDAEQLAGLVYNLARDVNELKQRRI